MSFHSPQLPDVGVREPPELLDSPFASASGAKYKSCFCIERLSFRWLARNRISIHLVTSVVANVIRKSPLSRPFNHTIPANTASNKLGMFYMNYSRAT
ncbi:hypothetical protein BABINDRAFT_113030 [Babjeviella inositovora NRRL Y-12698]|uniref:Uncharacterized protein n=1 Tax=Babjeviella inositovora NRRL Y-12698 TaxID=984486 RepID=A0A1E3QWL0_9ASCO|nr:uncharacterized protein BABINDRAFT_113030 [Babjeviella inositovora NRRL Y-12698]ODQ81904.1 hypothetical protein BABINDRAFT_113030 [Babjeviella inositovora NRRL Y-12698]